MKVDIPEAVATIQRAGIKVYAGLIFGGDQDTPAAADQIVEFVTRSRIFSAMTGMLTPVPHTPLYDRLRAEGRLKLDEFTGNNTDDSLQFEPRLMSVDQVRQGIDSILLRLFNQRATYGRSIEMLRGVQPHIFNRGKRQLRYIRGAGHMRENTLRCEQLRTVCGEAVRCLKVRLRQHRFPGLTQRPAFDAALKAFHYQRVAAAVVSRERAH